jgi:hypothetical protein
MPSGAVAGLPGGGGTLGEPSEGMSPARVGVQRANAKAIVAKNRFMWVCLLHSGCKISYIAEE